MITIPVGPLGRIAAALVVAAILVVVFLQKDIFFPGRGMQSSIDANRYQAVVLRGGIVYYGHADARSTDVVLLRDIYYLTNVTEQTPLGQLIKRGSEVHGPSEPMIIPVSEVAFIENLRDDSAVADAIRRFLGGERPAPPAPVTQPPATPAPITPATTAPATTRPPSPTPSPSPTR